MTNDRKRSAAAMQSASTGGSAGTPSSSTTSKKRKIDGVQKFYAVKAGRVPGVYLTYAECQAQTAGFKGAIFKSFTSKEDAAAFAAGKAVQAAADEPAKFYAVAVGNPTGIYNDWSDASEAIKGVKGPKYKRFGSRAEAVAYIKEFGNREAIEALGEKADDGDAKKKKDSKKERDKDKAAALDAEDGGILKIYTDGSSRANGQLGARAGFGVFFGQGDPRNVSEPLRGEPQTNQRAELTAIQRALEVAPAEQDVQIITDSQYSINCVTKWAVGWRRNGWTTAGGEPVKNRDLVQAVLDRMEEKRKAGGKTVFKWVKGHAADAGNVAADLLAVKGASMG